MRRFLPILAALILAAIAIQKPAVASAASGVGRHWLSTFLCPEGPPSWDCEVAGSRMTVRLETLDIPRWMSGRHTMSILQHLRYDGDSTEYVHEAGWYTESSINTYMSNGTSIVRLQKFFYITELSSDAQKVYGSPITVSKGSTMSVVIGLDKKSACKLLLVPISGCGSPDNKWTWEGNFYYGESATWHPPGQARVYEYSSGIPRISVLKDGTYVDDVIWGGNSDIKFYLHGWYHPPQLGQSYTHQDHHHWWGSNYKEEPQPERVNLYKKALICIGVACFSGSVGDSQVGDKEWHACTGYVPGTDCDDALEIPAGNCTEAGMGTKWPDPQKGPWVCVAITHTSWNNPWHRAAPPPGVGLSQVSRGPIPEYPCGACSVVNFKNGRLWSQLKVVATDADDWQCPANAGTDQVEFFIPSSPQYPQHERRVNGDISYILGTGGGVEGLIERYVGWDNDAGGVPRTWGAHQDGQGRSYQWVEWYAKPLPDYCP